MQGDDLEMTVCGVKPDPFIVTAPEDFKEVIWRKIGKLAEK